MANFRLATFALRSNLTVTDHPADSSQVINLATDGSVISHSDLAHLVNFRPRHQEPSLDAMN